MLRLLTALLSRQLIKLHHSLPHYGLKGRKWYETNLWSQELRVGHADISRRGPSSDFQSGQPCALGGRYWTRRLERRSKKDNRSSYLRSNSCSCLNWLVRRYRTTEASSHTFFSRKVGRHIFRVILNSTPSGLFRLWNVSPMSFQTNFSTVSLYAEEERSAPQETDGIRRRRGTNCRRKITAGAPTCWCISH